MSLILEALKKSEAERRAGELPSVVASNAWTPPKERPIWPVFLLFVLLVLGAAIYVNRSLIWPKQFSPTAETETAPSLAQRPSTPAPLAPQEAIDPGAGGDGQLAGVAPAQKPVDVQQAVIDPDPPATYGSAGVAPPMPSTAPETSGGNAIGQLPPGVRQQVESGELVVPNPELLIPKPPTQVEQVVTAEAALPAPLPEVIEESPANASEPPPAPKPAPAPVPAAAASNDPAAGAATDTAVAGTVPSAVEPAPPAPPPTPAVPSYYELSLATRQAMPAFKMSMHVFHPDPKRRFVIVNGNRIQEGGVVGQLLWLREIQPAGAVFEYDRQLFLLPRQGG